VPKAHSIHLLAFMCYWGEQGKDATPPLATPLEQHKHQQQHKHRHWLWSPEGGGGGWVGGGGGVAGGSIYIYPPRKGGRENKSHESDVHLPQPPQKKVATCFLLCFNFVCVHLHRLLYFVSRFWSFRKKGRQKNAIKPFSQKIIWAHHKKCVCFSPLRFYFSPSVVLLDFFREAGVRLFVERA
jgi:hypothetical protein